MNDNSRMNDFPSLTVPGSLPDPHSSSSSHSSTPGTSAVTVQEKRRKRDGRKWLTLGRLWALIVVSVGVLVFVLIGIPMPYVIEKPGPTFDVLAREAGTPLIDIGSDQATYTSTGELRMVTVSSFGGPGRTVTLSQLIEAYFDPSAVILKESDVYPSDLTSDELDKISQAQMEQSQSTSAVAALEELGYEVPAVVTISAAVPGSPAEGKVEDGDILRAITTPDGVRHEITSASTTFSLPKTLEAGTPIILEVQRGDQTLTIASETYRPDTMTPEESGSKFGIYLSVDAALPFPVTVHLEDVGGPSAGLIFALGIIDELTGSTSVNGVSVAGTGAISYTGDVEPIGGIVQKMHGATRDGAAWFLAPVSNCDEVVGHVPAGLEVWPVATLKEARHALELIRNGATIDHPTCDAIVGDSTK